MPVTDNATANQSSFLQAAKSTAFFTGPFVTQNITEKCCHKLKHKLVNLVEPKKAVFMVRIKSIYADEECNILKSASSSKPIMLLSFKNQYYHGCKADLNAFQQSMHSSPGYHQWPQKYQEHVPYFCDVDFSHRFISGRNSQLADVNWEKHFLLSWEYNDMHDKQGSTLTF